MEPASSDIGACVGSGMISWRHAPGGAPGWPGPTWIHEHLEINGARWFARISRVPAPAFRPIVMVHGVVVSGAYFRPVATELQGEFDIYIPDLPGTGASRTPGPVWDIGQLADGLARWMDWHHLRDAVLVSNSIGCQVLTMLAARRPDLAHSLMLVAPTMDPDVTSVLRVIARGVIDMPRERLSLWKVWVPDLLRSGARSSLQLLRLAIVDPQLERLPIIQTTTIVIGGEHDPIVPTDWIERMADLMPNGRSIVIPRAPHALNYTSPRQLARIIRVAADAWPEPSSRRP